MPDIAARGAAVISSRRWVESLGSAQYQRVLRRMPASSASAVTGIWATSLLQDSMLNDFWMALRAEWTGTEEDFVRAMREHGRFIAQDNLKGVLRSVLMFAVNPDQLFKLIPRLFGMYFKGAEAIVDTSQLHRKYGTCRALNFGALNYISPIICGWAEAAFATVGAGGFECTERHFSADALSPDPLFFELRWR